MKNVSLFRIVYIAFLLCGLRVDAIVAVTDPIDSTEGGSGTVWSPITSGDNDDYLNDKQTGTSGNIVGSVDTNQAAFYSAFDDNGSTSNEDGTLGFRLRLGKGTGQNNTGFGSYVFIGLELDGDVPIDMYIIIDAKTTKDAFDGSIGFYEATGGSTANISPSSTSIANQPLFAQEAFTSSNYNFQPVNNLEFNTNSDLNDNGEDYFMTASLDFAQLVAAAGRLADSITVTDQTPIRYMVATSQNKNNINEDINGLDGEVNSAMSWSDLSSMEGGGLTPQYYPDGTPVPEPSSYALMFGTLAGIVVLFRRRRSLC